MPLLRNPQVKQAYALCVERDGDKCALQDSTCAGNRVLDHKDNNPKNNPPDGSNWQILCRSHNRRKNPGAPRRFSNNFAGRLKMGYSQEVKRGRNREGIPIRGMSAEMRKSEEAKPKILKWIKDEIAKDKDRRIETLEAVNSGACIGDVKQKSVGEYIDAWTSRAGELEEKTIDGVEYLMLKEVR